MVASAVSCVSCAFIRAGSAWWLGRGELSLAEELDGSLDGAARACEASFGAMRFDVGWFEEEDAGDERVASPLRSFASGAVRVVVRQSKCGLFGAVLAGLACCSGAAPGSDDGGRAEDRDALARARDAWTHDDASLDVGMDAGEAIRDAGSPLDVGSLESGSDGRIDGARVEDGSAALDAVARPDTDGVSYAWDVQPILVRRCGLCHGGLADLEVRSYASIRSPSSFCAPGTSKGECSLLRVRDGTMPMGGGCSGDPTRDVGNPSCLDAAEHALLEAWVRDGQPP